VRTVASCVGSLEKDIGPSTVCYQFPAGNRCNVFEDRWPNRDLAGYYADYAGILAKYLGDRITVWAPFNMRWSFTCMGYGVGPFPPGHANSGDFLKVAHTRGRGASLDQGSIIESYCGKRLWCVSGVSKDRF
jgi:hypothetical protein